MSMPKKAKLSSSLPVLDEALATLQEAHQLQTDVIGVHIKDAVFTKENLKDICLRGSLLENCQFEDCNLERSAFVDVVFTGCNLSNSNFLDAHFNCCEFRGGKAMGTNFCGAFFKDVLFANSNLQYVRLFQTKMVDCAFTYCDLTKGDISESKLTRMTFQESKLNGINVTQTPLKGIDFTSCQTTDWLVPIVSKELQGAVFDFAQAADIGCLMGIKIK